MNKKHTSNEFIRPPHCPILLASKMQMPRIQPHIIERQRLMRKLNQETKGKLTCVAAPAGFGKTTAVGEWLRSKGLPAGWVSLDSADNNLIRFWDYLTAALNHIFPGITKKVLPNLYSEKSPDLEMIVTQLIDHIYSFSEEFVLILDDYHVIHHASIHESLGFFIQNASNNVHIIIISRMPLPMHLSQLRIKGQLTEISGEDLRFTLDEASEFYKNLDIILTFEELKILESCIEGWGAGMHLAALLINKKKDYNYALKSLRGDCQEMSSYFLEEVFNLWPEEIREFLLCTSILSQLEEGLCDLLTGRNDSRDILDVLSHNYAFVTVINQEEGLYRYHYLFRQFLRSHLQTTRKDRLSLLYQKSGQWYEQNGYYPEAVQHYVQGGHYEQTVILLEKKSPEIIKGMKDVSIMVSCFKTLPQHLVEGSPMLCLTYGWVLSLDGQLKEALLWARKAEAVNLERRPGASEGKLKMKKQITGEIALLRAYIALREKKLSQIVKQGTKASHCLVRESIFIKDAVTFNQFEISLLAGPFGFHGQLNRVVRSLFANNLVPVLKKIGFPEEYILVPRAELFYEYNELDLALPLLMEGINQAEKMSSFGALVPAFFTLAKISRAKGDLEGAMEVVSVAENKVRSAKLFQWLPLLEALNVRLFLDMGKIEPVTRWMQKNQMGIYDKLKIKREYEYITLAQVLLAQKNYDKAQMLLTRLQLFAEELDRIPSIIEIFNLQALAYQEMGETNMAMFPLNKSLFLGEKEGYLRAFVDKGAPMAALLKKNIRWRASKEFQGAEAVSTAYIRKIILLIKKESSLRRVYNNINGVFIENNKLPLEPLTLKEIQVLRLLAQELSNQEIADSLSVKLNTVKVHTRHIYHKLDVNNRIRAVDRAKKLEII